MSTLSQRDLDATAIGQRSASRGLRSSIISHSVHPLYLRLEGFPPVCPVSASIRVAHISRASLYTLVPPTSRRPPSTHFLCPNLSSTSSTHRIITASVPAPPYSLPTSSLAPSTRPLEPSSPTQFVSRPARPSVPQAQLSSLQAWLRSVSVRPVHAHISSHPSC